MTLKKPHPYYFVWASMHDRCRNPNFRQWDRYGGRGIKVCERWKSFQAFVDDMGERPAGFSLDRIDNDGDYTPENCRWASRSTQQLNREKAVYVEIEGVRYRAIELARQIGIKTDTLIERASKNMPFAWTTSPEKRHNRDGLALGVEASVAAKKSASHCLRGHAFDDANTQISPQGWRRCRQCHNAKMRAQNAAKRAALICDG